jgi:hypothetical protein
VARYSIGVMALLASAGTLLAPVAARSELVYPPSQTIADRGTWLPFAPAPAHPAGICLIDSGVNLNPDTESQVIDREALDGGSPNDVSPVQHGTLMAMEMAAPFNGWGTIGAAPTAVRIVSIRAESTTDALTVGAYKQAIVACQDLAARRPEFNLKVINLSLGFQGQPSPEQLAELEDAATTAHNAGLDIVAAAGDEGSQSISYPAAVSPIIAVGASGANHAPCSFSNTGPQLALLAPGCDLQEANPISGAPMNEYGGTSQAAATTSAAGLAALRAYEPGIGPSQAEQLLITAARAAGGSLDVTALFQAAGLENIIEAGERNEPTTPPPSTPAPVALHRERGTPSRRLPRPRLSVRHRGNTLFVRFLNLPVDGQAILNIFSRKHGRSRAALAHMTTRHRVVRLRLQTDTVVDINYAPLQAGQARNSPTKVIKL